MSLDWQFLVVSMVALGALGVLVRRLVPVRRRRAGRPEGPGDAGRPVQAACAHCASNPQTSAPARAPRTSTTPVVLLRDLRK